MRTLAHILFVLALLACLWGLYLLLLRCRRGNPGWGKLEGRRYAHRGFHDKPRIPENSLIAFRRAIERGWGAELDVHLLKDGTLAVFHDSDLRRCTGAEGEIEDLDRTGLSALRLEGTDEPVPLFDQVLDLYEHTGLPLLIELKVARGNYRELTEAVCRRLDTYTGEYTVESFDPRALLWLKRIRPDIIRGQLSQDFIKKREGLPYHQAVLLTNLAFNRIVQPDFIAYRFTDRMVPALRREARRKGIPEAMWTIKTPEEYRTAVREGCIPIFEQFDPDNM